MSRTGLAGSRASRAGPRTEPVSSGRTSWSRDELLGALQALEPRSWSAWVFVIALTTGTRLGEPVAAVKEWYDFAGMHPCAGRIYKDEKGSCAPDNQSNPRAIGRAHFQVTGRRVHVQCAAAREGRLKGQP